jgi:hypothetical protein
MFSIFFIRGFLFRYFFTCRNIMDKALCYKLQELMKWMIFINLLNPSNCTGPRGSLCPWQKWIPVAEKKLFWGVECGRCMRLTTSLPYVSWLSRHCVILNISQPFKPPWPVRGIALRFVSHKINFSPLYEEVNISYDPGHFYFDNSIITFSYLNGFTY